MANSTIIKSAIAIIPILLGAMYFSGVIYDCYWFHIFGIDKDVFPQSIQQYMVTGVLSYVMSATEVITTVLNASLLISALSVVLIVYLYMFGSDIKKTAPVRWISRKFGQTWFVKSITLVLIPIIFFSFYFLTLLILAIIVLSAGSAGASAAQSKIKSFGSGVDRVTVMFKADVEMSFEGDVYEIKCNEDRCAFYVGGKAVVTERDLIASISSYVQENSSFISQTR